MLKACHIWILLTTLIFATPREIGLMVSCPPSGKQNSQSPPVQGILRSCFQEVASCMSAYRSSVYSNTTCTSILFCVQVFSAMYDTASAPPSMSLNVGRCGYCIKKFRVPPRWTICVCGWEKKIHVAFRPTVSHLCSDFKVETITGSQQRTLKYFALICG